MSDDRIYDLSFTRTIARVEGKLLNKPISTRFRIYHSGQFKKRLDGRNFSRRIPAMKRDREDFYLNMYRLKIKDTWYNPGPESYQFFSLDEIMQIMKETI